MQNQQEEIWKDIPGYEGLYQASSLGRVKSLERKSWNGFSLHLKKEIILKQSKQKKYFITTLSKENKTKSFLTHQLIAMAFLGHIPCGFKLVVDHIDNDTTNNNLDNIQLLTNRENVNKRQLNKTSKYPGVYFNKNEKKWKTSICISGKRQVYLGYFINEIDAYKTYQKALSNLDKYENDKQFRELIKTLNQQ
jgi:hypothetical protein